MKPNIAILWSAWIFIRRTGNRSENLSLGNTEVRYAYDFMRISPFSSEYPRSSSWNGRMFRWQGRYILLFLLISSSNSVFVDFCDWSLLVLVSSFEYRFYFFRNDFVPNPDVSDVKGWKKSDGFPMIIHDITTSYFWSHLNNRLASFLLIFICFLLKDQSVFFIYGGRWCDYRYLLLLMGLTHLMITNHQDLWGRSCFFF